MSRGITNLKDAFNTAVMASEQEHLGDDLRHLMNIPEDVLEEDLLSKKTAIKEEVKEEDGMLTAPFITQVEEKQSQAEEETTYHTEEVKEEVKYFEDTKVFEEAKEEKVAIKKTAFENKTDLDNIIYIIKLLDAFRKKDSTTKENIGALLGIESKEEAPILQGIMNISDNDRTYLLELSRLKGLERTERAFSLVAMEDSVVRGIGMYVCMLTDEEIKDTKNKIEYCKQVEHLIDDCDDEITAFVSSFIELLKIER